MKSDPENFLNQLVVTALTIFVLVLLFLAALVWRQWWLQQQMARLSGDVKANLEDLEIINEDLQDQLAEIQSDGGLPDVEVWEQVAEGLNDVGQQLEMLGEELEEVTTILAPPLEETVAVSQEQDPAIVPDQVDQVFTLFAALFAGAAIIVAILLGAAALQVPSLKYGQD